MNVLINPENKIKQIQKKDIITNDKYRYELKYLLNMNQMEMLKNRIGSILPIDKNAAKAGYYNIRSIYFDDYQDTSLRQVIDGISDREKYRIRFYNADSSYIALEKKQKTNNMTNKISCRITEQQLMDIIENKEINIKKEQPKLLNELYLNMKIKGYKPVCIIEYDRIPYIYNAGNVRITLDYNMSVSYDYQNIFNKELSVVPIINRNESLLEVKYNGFIPDFIRWSLQLNTLTRFSYSKYANSRLVLNNIF